MLKNDTSVSGAMTEGSRWENNAKMKSDKIGWSHFVMKSTKVDEVLALLG